MAFNFKQFFSVLTGIAPIILLAVPGGAALAPLVPLIVTGIADAQKKTVAGVPMTGPEKKAYVLKLVEDAALAANIVKPSTIDVPLIVEAAGHGVDAVITSVNAVQTAHAALPNVPAVLVVA